MRSARRGRQWWWLVALVPATSVDIEGPLEALGLRIQHVARRRNSWALGQDEVLASHLRTFEPATRDRAGDGNRQRERRAIFGQKTSATKEWRWPRNSYRAWPSQKPGRVVRSELIELPHETARANIAVDHPSQFGLCACGEWVGMDCCQPMGVFVAGIARGRSSGRHRSSPVAQTSRFVTPLTRCWAARMSVPQQQRRDGIAHAMTHRLVRLRPAFSNAAQRGFPCAFLPRTMGQPSLPAGGRTVAPVVLTTGWTVLYDECPFCGVGRTKAAQALREPIFAERPKEREQCPRLYSPLIRQRNSKTRRSRPQPMASGDPAGGHGQARRFLPRTLP